MGTKTGKRSPRMEAARGASPSIGKALKVARTRRGLTLREVEEQTGISNAHLSQIERELIRKPDQTIIWKLSRLYELDFALLSEWAGYRHESSGPEGAYLAAALRLLNDMGERDLEEAIAYLEQLNSRGGES